MISTETKSRRDTEPMVPFERQSIVAIPVNLLAFVMSALPLLWPGKHAAKLVYDATALP